MAFTFDDLKAEIKGSIKRNDIDDLINQVLQEGVNSICDEHPFSWLREEKSLQTTPGNSIYNITEADGFGASDYKKRYDLRLDQSNSSAALVYMAPDLFLSRFGINNDTGVPAAYTEWEGSVILGPAPNDVYALILRYIRKHPSSGTILVPEKEIVKRAAMMRLYIDLDVPELAQPHALLYEKLLIQLLEREHHLDYLPQVICRDL